MYYYIYIYVYDVGGAGCAKYDAVIPPARARFGRNASTDKTLLPTKRFYRRNTSTDEMLLTIIVRMVFFSVFLTIRVVPGATVDTSGNHSASKGAPAFFRRRQNLETRFSLLTNKNKCEKIT